MDHGFHKFRAQMTMTEDICVHACFSKFEKTATKIYKDFFFFFRLSKQNACRRRYKLNHIVEHQPVSREGLCLFERYLFTFQGEKKTTLKSLFCAKLLTRPNKSKQEMISLRQHVFSGVIFKLQCALRVQQAYHLFK